MPNVLFNYLSVGVVVVWYVWGHARASNVPFGYLSFSVVVKWYVSVNAVVGIGYATGTLDSPFVCVAVCGKFVLDAARRVLWVMNYMM